MREHKKLFREGAVLDLLLQITLALEYVHSKNILHRDIKSENIFLKQGNRVKLGDFGVCRVLLSYEDDAASAIGTPAFASPEVCQFRRYNNKADIWSLGCVLFELMTLHPPFGGASFHEIQRNVARGKYLDPPV